MKHELYEKRFTIYLAARSLLRNIVVQANVTDAMLIEYWAGINPSRFLLNKDITEYLEKIEHKAVDLQTKLAEARESDVLQTLGERVEIDEVRYPERESDCILCGRCVAACAEVAETGTKGAIGRGMSRHIGLPFYKDEFCQKCYECSERCPIDIVPQSRRDPCGVCGSELSKNEEIPEICEDCVLE